MGRTSAHFERRGELNGKLRSAYAAALGADTADVALTTCTSEGIALTVSGLALQRGDEILTSDEEHPGLLGRWAPRASCAAYRSAKCRCRGSPKRSVRTRGSSPARTSAG